MRGSPLPLRAGIHIAPYVGNMGWRRESERLLAFEYELMPSQEQQRAMRRFVYDRALALQNANHEAGNKFIG